MRRWQRHNTEVRNARAGPSNGACPSSMPILRHLRGEGERAGSWVIPPKIEPPPLLNTAVFFVMYMVIGERGGNGGMVRGPSGDRVRQEGRTEGEKERVVNAGGLEASVGVRRDEHDGSESGTEGHVGSDSQW